MASFTNEKQLQNSFFHSLSKTATEGTQLPFESPYKSGHSIYLQDVLGEEVPFAGDVTTADLMVTLNPSVIKKYDKVPLTPVAGSNNQAWCLYDSGKFVKPWIEPTDVMNSVGDLSHGYQIRLYKENGDFIPPTLGAYNFLGYSGLVIFNEGYTPVDLGWGNVKISVYVYIGTSLRDSLGGVLSGSTWLSPVKGIAIDNTLIDTPEEGDRYLIGVGAVNDWENHDNEIATYTSGTWVFQEPKKGDTVSNFDNYSVYNYNNITWVEVLINQWVTQDGFMKTKTPLGIDLQDNPLDNVSRIDFKTDYNVLDFKEGRLFWDDIYQTLRIINNDSETRRLGMDSWVQVYNNSGADIPKGSVVYIYNSDNETPVIKLALSDDYETSYLIGIVIENISNEEKGNVLYYGVIEGIDTDGFTEGDILYISDDIAGSFENVKPDGGSYIISLGIVLKSDSVNGEILFYSNPQSFPKDNEFKILHFDDDTKSVTFNLEDIGTGENREIKIYDENIGLSNTIYSNANPMPEKIGGLEIGATFDNIPIWQVLDTMLYPYQYPAFTSFSIGGQNTTLEVGASTTDNPEFLWATSNSSNIKTDSVELIDVSGGDVSIISNIGNTGSYVSSISGVSRNTAGSYVFRIKGLNSKSQNFQRDLTLNWRWRFYYGESNSDTLTEADVKNLRVGNLGAGYTGTYNFSPTGYKYLCYPVSWGSLSGWKDQSNNLPIPLASPYIVSITNINGVTEDYYCYRTYNILGGSITAVVS